MELCQKLKVVDGQDRLSQEAQKNATLLFMSHLRATLASKRVLGEYKLTYEAFRWVVGEVESRFNEVRAVSNHKLRLLCVVTGTTRTAGSVYGFPCILITLSGLRNNPWCECVCARRVPPLYFVLSRSCLCFIEHVFAGCWVAAKLHALPVSFLLTLVLLFLSGVASTYCIGCLSFAR